VLAVEARSSGRRARVVDTEDDDGGSVCSHLGAGGCAARRFDNEIRANSNPVSRARRVRLWTDDYSNLFQILK